MTANTRFTTTNVKWQYQRSKAIGSNEMVRAGVEQIEVTCSACGHAWTARRSGHGKFSPAVGHILLECPSCGQQGAVAGKDLENN